MHTEQLINWMIIITAGLVLLFLSGCATHKEVDVKCALAVQTARCSAIVDQASINAPVIDKINELDRRLKAIERKSEVGRVASARTNQESGLDWVKFERDVDGAIAEAKRMTEEEAEIDEANAELFRIIKRWRTTQQLRELAK